MADGARRTRANFRRAARKIEQWGSSVGEQNVAGLRVIGEEIMTDVKASRPGHGVPVDTGALRASGRAVGPRPDDSVLLGFGGTAVPYALVQHERLDYHHDVGEARYLVRGVDRWRASTSVAIAALKAQVRATGRRIGRSV